MKFLLAGLGSIGQRHARNLRTLLGDEVELLAYRRRRSSPVIGPDLRAVEGDPEREYGIRAFDRLEDALAERPDAVFVTNPNHLHVPVARAAAEAGCHLFLEKPVSHDLEGVAELADLVERNGLVCLVGYQLRFHPALPELRRLLGEGGLGRVVGVRLVFGEWIPGWHPWEDYRETYAARADEGGGVLLTQIHDLDWLYALFGLPRRVFAFGGKLSSLDLDAEDTASVLLDYGFPAHVHQDLVRRPPVRRCEVIGEAGVADWDSYGNTLTVVPSEGEPRVTGFAGFERNQLFLDELRHFLACLRGEEQPVVDLPAGIETLRIALAAKRSLETGRVETP